MAAADIPFLRMTEAEMQRYAEAHPGRVNEQDENGSLLLTAAVHLNVSIDLITWLVDEKGADVDGRNRWRHTALFYAKSAEVLSCLLERQASPTVQDDEGWTALMDHSWYLRADCVERLLPDPRVVALIDVQATGDCMRGCSALHAACLFTSTQNERRRIVSLLLRHGANPFLQNAVGRTPLDAIRRRHPDDHTTISFLERAMNEPQRTFLLSKARHINDANHAISKAKEGDDLNNACTDSEKMDKMLAKTPPYLKERVQDGQVDLPLVELMEPQKHKMKKKRVAVLKYVLRDEEEYGEMGGMSVDVFVELMEMVAIEWDPIRGTGGGGGDGGGSDVSGGAAAPAAAPIAAAVAGGEGEVMQVEEMEEEGQGGMMKRRAMWGAFCLALAIIIYVCLHGVFGFSGRQ